MSDDYQRIEIVTGTPRRRRLPGRKLPSLAPAQASPGDGGTDAAEV